MQSLSFFLSFLHFYSKQLSASLEKKRIVRYTEGMKEKMYPARGCAAAYLAGGMSRRMGRDKAMLAWGDEPLLTRLARRFSCFDEQLLSTNNPFLTLPGVQSVPDIRPGCGPLGGIHAVLHTCRAQRVFFLPCDMPYMTADIAFALLDALADGDACAAVVDGRVQPLAAVYAKSALPAIDARIARGDFRLQALLCELDCRKLPLRGAQSRRAFFNVNTPEDWAALPPPSEEE